MKWKWLERFWGLLFYLISRHARKENKDEKVNDGKEVNEEHLPADTKVPVNNQLSVGVIGNNVCKQDSQTTVEKMESRIASFAETFGNSPIVLLMNLGIISDDNFSIHAGDEENILALISANGDTLELKWKEERNWTWFEVNIGTVKYEVSKNNWNVIKKLHITKKEEVLDNGMKLEKIYDPGIIDFLTETMMIRCYLKGEGPYAVLDIDQKAEEIYNAIEATKVIRDGKCAYDATVVLAKELMNKKSCGMEIAYSDSCGRSNSTNFDLIINTYEYESKKQRIKLKYDSSPRYENRQLGISLDFASEEAKVIWNKCENVFSKIEGELERAKRIIKGLTKKVWPEEEGL